MSIDPEKVRAVLDAARSFRADMLSSGEEASPSHYVDLWEAVDAFEEELRNAEPNRPYGFKLTRPWSLVPSGWFVQIPSGAWFEVIASKANGIMQDVTLRNPETGAEGTFPRKRDAEVTTRRGSRVKELSDAIEALSDVFGGVEIVDSPPWDE